MSTYVLVPGMCHGGWCFEPLPEGLRAHGHRVLTVTPTGLSERAHLLTSTVNLDTHVTDVLALLEAERVDDAVLVGHSYGGMVVGSVADRAPERVRGLVYLDAFVPRDGDSCWSLTTDEQREWYLGVDDSGFAVPPLPFFDPRATAHPLATLLQRARITGPGPDCPRTYVYATRWPGLSPFAATYERLREDPAWTVHALDSAHNLMRDAPAELERILLDAG
ncbi:alpha/beta hydrolase family protein [Pseudonocardia sediminis]|uniref:Alpha/beta hydrolase family protein n=1 Tax=Pseudonocardia sediminis TaxID=1397368 RepID=A0A4Q7URF6_PSEST|nr:alpha/beta fold hydrolase [Pseudonocardia sediminis]RZT84275.1 alpha/beta hydrolase family protein [Pseudonocardia sediminis]